MEPRALLLANGEVTRREIQRLSSVQFKWIVAADGGAHHALRWNLPLHYIVGDLDSVPPKLRSQLPETRFIHRPSQEHNDLEKTLQFCQELGVVHLTLLGMTGKRLDHTLTNLSVLSRYDHCFRLTILDPHGEMFLVREHFTYTGKIGQLISLLPLYTAEGITTRGLAFPLNHESLHWGKREGLSNYIVENPVQLSIKRGRLLVMALYPDEV